MWIHIFFWIQGLHTRSQALKGVFSLGEVLRFLTACTVDLKVRHSNFVYLYSHNCSVGCLTRQ